MPCFPVPGRYQYVDGLAAYIISQINNCKVGLNVVQKCSLDMPPAFLFSIPSIDQLKQLAFIQDTKPI